MFFWEELSMQKRKKRTKSSTRIQTTITELKTKLDEIDDSALTNEDLNDILDEVAAIKAAVDELKNNNDNINDEVANLDAEVDDILEKLGELLAANAVVQGDLRITNLGDLEVAQDLINTDDDDPEVTIQGNLYVLINDTNGLKDSLVAVNKITNKIKIVQKTATVTTNSAIELNALTYVTENYALSGTGSVADGKLRTINGAMTIDLGGDLDYSRLSSIGSDGVTISQTSTVTSVDFGGLVTGKILTGAASISLPNATSVKVGGVLPAVVDLPKATTFESTYVGSAQTTTTITIGGDDASFSLGAKKFTGQVTITTTGDVNLPQLTESKALNIDAGADSTIDLSEITEITGATTLSATTVNIGALKSSTETITLIGPTSVSLPALTTLEGDFVAADAESFSAPLLATSTGTIDLKAAATVELKSLTATTTIIDIATITGLTLKEQAATVDISDFVHLVSLDYTGSKPSTITPGSQVAANNLTISSANASLTTLVIGASGGIGTLTVSDSTLESLSTAGIIINTVVTSNTQLETFDFQHTHVNGDDATTVSIIGNTDSGFNSVDLSSLAKVKEVVITGNSSLRAVVAPSTSMLAEPVATITVTINTNDTSGTYTPAKAPTETTPYEAASATAAVVSSFKPFIEAYQAQTRTASVTYAIDVDNVDRTDTSATETTALSVHLGADTAATNGPDGTAGNTDDQTDGGAVSTKNELALFD